MTNVKCPKCNHEWEDETLHHDDELGDIVTESNADSAEQASDID